MRRVLGVELRRSAAPWLGVGFLATALLVAPLLPGPLPIDTGAGSSDWPTQWTALGLWVRSLMLLAWPVVVGLGGLLGMRRGHNRMDDLLAATPRPAWQPAAVLAAAVALASTAAVLVLTAVGVPAVVAGTDLVRPDVLPTLAVGVLALVAGGLLGMAAGHLAPYRATPPALALGALALIMTAQWYDATQEVTPVTLLSPALNGPNLSSIGIAGAVHLGQAVLYLGLAAAALLVVSLRRHRVLAAGPAALAVGVALAVFPSATWQAYPDDPAAMAPVCDTAGPRVCVIAAHSARLDEVAAVGRQVLAELSVLPNAPTSVWEVPIAFGPSADDDTMRFGAGSALRPQTELIPPGALPIGVADTVPFVDTGWAYSDTTDPERLRRSMLSGAGTLLCPEVPEQAVEVAQADRAARWVVGSWLVGDARPVLPDYGTWGRSTLPEQAERMYAQLLALPRAEQVQRVTAFREAALHCTGDLAGTLVGPAVSG